MFLRTSASSRVMLYTDTAGLKLRKQLLILFVLLRFIVFRLGSATIAARQCDHVAAFSFDCAR